MRRVLCCVISVGSPLGAVTAVGHVTKKIWRPEGLAAARKERKMNSDLFFRFAIFALTEGGSIPDAINLLRSLKLGFSPSRAASWVRLILKHSEGDFEFRVREKMLAHGFTQEEVSQILAGASLD